VKVGLRAAGLGDRDEVERLLQAYLFEFDGRSEPYPYLDAYWVDPERAPFLIEADGRAVGICLIRIREDGWRIAEFAVEPSHRRAGIGRRAVEALVERARRAGARHLEAKIHPRNGDALLFWSAVGFDPVPASGVLTTRRLL
jgi:GNAT superfamily N-acetyltransferase